MEVLGFKFTDEEELEIIKVLLANLEMININLEIAENVISIRQKKKIKLPDAIILATAKFMNCDLLTKNVKDFLNVLEDVNIVEPLENKQSESGENEENEQEETK